MSQKEFLILEKFTSQWKNEELAAIRLSDVEKLNQETATDTMDISRQTYRRILSNARSIISNALIAGKVLRIGGGNFEIRGRRRQRRRKGGRI